MPRQKSVSSVTIGCKANLADTQAILSEFIKRGYRIVDNDQRADVYIVNTCTVTNVSDKKSKQAIRKAIRQNPNAHVIVSGCYAKLNKEEAQSIEGVSLVISASDREAIAHWLDEYADNANKTTTYDSGLINAGTLNAETISISTFGERTRAYVKVQDGCTNFCSYCIVPYARGDIKSKHPEDVLREVDERLNAGYKEIVITGINICAYGRDLTDLTLATAEQLDLIALLDRICTTYPQLARLRLGSLEPDYFNEQRLNRLAPLSKRHPALCDHLHLSLQSGSDNILKAMNRHYTTEDYRRTVSRLREIFPHLGLTTDVIVGFPGETEADFRRTCEFVTELGFSRLHVFPFSPKRGTKAADMPDQCTHEIKERRSQELIAIAKDLAQDFMQKQKGRSVSVLFEQKYEDQCQGYTTNYIRAVAAGVAENELKSLRVIGTDGETLICE